MAENENPLRKNELRIIALLSGMIMQYKETNTLDDVSNLICKTADEILDVCEIKTSNENSALPIPDVSQQREQLRAFVDWYNLNRQKNETMIEYYDIRRYLEALNCG